MIPVLVLTARVLLATVFALAAMSKVFDGAEFRNVLSALQIPNRLLRPLAVLLPMAELAAAVGLVFTQLTWVAALACVSLLLLFSIAAAVGLAGGKSLECRCFGVLGAKRLDWLTLLRNLALGGVAVFLLLFGRHEGASRAGDGLAVACAASLAAAFAVLAHIRASQRSRRIGDPAPRQLLRDLSGETIDLRAVGEGGTLLIFWDASCTACEQMRQYLPVFEGRSEPGTARVVIVSTDAPETIRAADLRLPVVRDDSHALARALGIPGKPAAVRLDPAGHIASAVILGTAPIVAAFRDILAEGSVTRRTEPHALSVAKPARSPGRVR